MSPLTARSGKPDSFVDARRVRSLQPTGCSLEILLLLIFAYVLRLSAAERSGVCPLRGHARFWMLVELFAAFAFAVWAGLLFLLGFIE